jgi:hypothetical protein
LYCPDSSTCFLETEEGRGFVRMFEKVRWMYVVSDMSCIQLLKEDKILPLGQYFLWTALHYN